MFEIAVDAGRKLIRATMWGFMTVEEVYDFSRQEQTAIKRMGCGSGEFLLLIETHGATTQSQDVVAAFQDIIVNSPLKAKKIASVRAGSLSRIQTRRMMMVRENIAVFETVEEAEVWLLAPPEG
ncbi:MAG TPA: hypothetical protein VFQ57_09365 [Sphingomonas sp.]|jgi:hypothetical protein|nr:hypothetical protein [Sphingomonas sp.]